MISFVSTLLVLGFLQPFDGGRVVEPLLLNSWTVRLGEGETALEENQLFFLGGLQSESEYFYTADLHSQVSKRWMGSGQAVWSTNLESPSHTLWALGGEALIGGDTKGNIYRISADNGEVIWKTNSKGIVFSKPLIHGNLVYVQNSYGVLQAYDLETGVWQWQQEDSGVSTQGLWRSQGPLLFDGRILVGFPSGVLQAFEPLTGNRLWTKNFQANLNDGIGLNDVASIQTKDEFLVASSYNGDLKVWKSASGSLALVWEKKLSLHTSVTFDPTEPLIYVTGRDQKVSAFELSSGYLKWESGLFDSLLTSVSLAGSHLWLLSSSGVLTVLDKTSGKPIAQTSSVDSPFYQAPLALSQTEAISVDSRGFLRRHRLHFSNLSSSH